MMTGNQVDISRRREISTPFQGAAPPRAAPNGFEQITGEQAAVIIRLHMGTMGIPAGQCWYQKVGATAQEMRALHRAGQQAFWFSGYGNQQPIGLIAIRNGENSNGKT